MTIMGDKVYVGIPITEDTIGLWFIDLDEKVWLCELHYDAGDLIIFMMTPPQQREPSIARTIKPVDEIIKAVDDLYGALIDTADNDRHFRIMMSAGGIEEFVHQLKAHPWAQRKMETLH